MKLFPKLVLATSLLLLASVAGVTFCLDWLQEQGIREQAARQRQVVLDNLTHIAEESILTNDDLLLIKYIRLLSKWDRSLVSASVVDPNGAVLAHSEPTRIGKQVMPEHRSTSNTFVLNAPIRLGNHWSGSASVAFSTSDSEEQVRKRLFDTRLRAAVIATVSLLLGAFFSFALASSWTRPIERLAGFAGEIGKGNWNFNVEGDLNLRRDEIGSLLRSFQNMAEQLKQLDILKEDFVSAVTHELRSPLGAIESYIDLIADEIKHGVPVSEWKDCLARIRINTQRLTHFVNDLLDVAALERGKIKLDQTPLDLRDLIEEVAGLFSRKCIEKNIAFQISPCDKLPFALADGDKIRQVLINLISNAIKFTPCGGRIDLAIQATNGLIQVSVSDSGIGIAKTDQVKLFNKFEQVRSARQCVKGPKGTGLGLAISRTLIELHGGTLWVDSMPDEGSVFHFTVPQVPFSQLQFKEVV